MALVPLHDDDWLALPVPLRRKLDGSAVYLRTLREAGYVAEVAPPP